LTVFNYFIAIVIQRSQKKHFFRCIAILINITAFTIPRLIEAGAAAKLSISLDYLIPLGIAFFTLQNIGYVLDVSRGIIPAEHNFWNYLLFILFFAKLSAGPIEPARHFLPQVENEHKYDPGKIYWAQITIECFDA
jgi:D-alanyl-lipoteichoic acid acyltransferase DltB (MBOAT superfamily)